MTVDLDWTQILLDDPRFLGGDLLSVYLVFVADGAAMLAGWGGPPPSGSDGVYTKSEQLTWSILGPIAALSNAFIFTSLLDVLRSASSSTSRQSALQSLHQPYL